MTIQESLRRVLEDRDGVAALFYELFFDRHPEAKPLFQDVNLKYQTVLLTMALMVVERHYAGGYRATQLYLQHLGHKHHQRAVPPEMYPRWVESLLAALDRASDMMLAGYREPVHV